MNNAHVCDLRQSFINFNIIHKLSYINCFQQAGKVNMWNMLPAVVW